MSRISRPPVEPGQVTDATTLNNTYADYSQAGALNAENTRDQAFDLPHFTNVKIIENRGGPVTLGNSQMLHIAPFLIVNSNLASPPTVTPVQTTAGTETRLDFSASPWVIPVGQCLRVWWDLSVYFEIPSLVPLPFNRVNALGRYQLPNGSGGFQTITDGMHCWLAYLQWDITSGALTNWVAVPGQQDPSVNLGGSGYDGFFLNNMNGATVLSPWMLDGSGDPENGTIPNNGTPIEHGWYGAHSMYVHAPSQQVTVYGIRIVLTGILHPAHFAGSGRNVLLYDYNAADALVQMTYSSGRLTALQQRMY